MSRYQALENLIRDSRNIVFFGGAGVSTESGIPDFRSANGLFSNTGAVVSPERIISASYFHAYPEVFFQFYKEKMIFPDAKPNSAHIALTELERMGKLSAIVTQNIDGLHGQAGSKNVIELHGSIHRNYCQECKKPYTLSFVLESAGVPLCPACGGIVRPDVVLYEEALPSGAINQAVFTISRADLLIIGGTSLVVQPAASLTAYFSGSAIAVINLDATDADRTASVVIHAPVGEVLEEVVAAVKATSV